MAYQAAEKIEAYHQELVTPKVLSLPKAHKRGVEHDAQPLDLKALAEVHGNRTHLTDFGRYTGFEVREPHQ